MKDIYPYHDTTTWCLKHEVWRPIPGYEEYYEVSNLGRVRSVDRVIPHPRIKSQFIKGKILKQKVILHNNTLDEQPMVDLQVSLSRDGRQYFQNVRRLVYSSFIRPLAYKKDNLYVINIDCNGYNNRVENVRTIEKKQKFIRSSKRGRVPVSHLKVADRSKWPLHGGQVNRKPVQQLDLNGKILDSFKSITEASRATGFGEKEIIGVAKGRYKQWSGFKWRYI